VPSRYFYCCLRVGAETHPYDVNSKKYYVGQGLALTVVFIVDFFKIIVGDDAHIAPYNDYRMSRN